MAHTNTVILSRNASDAPLCVDVFRRADGTFGFEEFRRDPEDGRGWFAVGHHGHLVFGCAATAMAAAKAAVAWLDD